MSKLYCLLALLLLQACSVHNHVANRDWHVVATENFIIYTDSNVELVAELAKDLERFRITVPNLTTASLIEDKKLIIYAAGSQTTYRALVGDDLANKTAGSFQPNMYGDIAFVNMSAYANTRKHKSYWVRRFLFHEYTHFLAHTNTPVNYPYWYIEGYAELLSTMEFDGNKINLGGIPAEREYDLVVNGLMDVQALLTAQRGSLSKHDNAGLYASAWLFVHMISMTPQYQEKIPDYLLLQAKSSNPIAAFEQGFGISVEQADKDLKAYLKGKIVRYNYVNDSGFEEFDVAIKALAKYEVAINLGRLHALSGKTVDQLMAFKRAFVDADSSDSAFNYALLLTYIQEERLEDAQQLAESLVIKDSTDPWPLFVKAEWLRKQAQLQGQDRRALLEQAYYIYKHLLDEDRKNASLWYGLGMSASQLMVKPAVYARYFGQAYMINARYPAIINAYLDALHEAEDWPSLVAVIRPIIARSPDVNTRLMLKQYMDYAEKQMLN